MTVFRPYSSCVCIVGRIGVVSGGQQHIRKVNDTSFAIPGECGVANEVNYKSNTTQSPGVANEVNYKPNTTQIQSSHYHYTKFHFQLNENITRKHN